MRAPLRFPLAELRPGPRDLPKPAAHYILRVHRRRAGDALVAFEPELGLEAPGHLVRAERGQVSAYFEAPRQSAYQPWPVTLLHALSKGAKPDEVLRHVTALGVARLVWVVADRSVARAESTRWVARRARLHAIACDAARQCGRGRLPEVVGPIALEPALQGASGLRLLLQPGALPLGCHLTPWSGATPCCLLVGPEGGWSGAEQQQAEGSGFVGASLGGSVLRTELCATAAVACAVAFAQCASFSPVRD